MFQPHQPQTAPRPACKAGANQKEKKLTDKGRMDTSAAAANTAPLLSNDCPLRVTLQVAPLAADYPAGSAVWFGIEKSRRCLRGKGFYLPLLPLFLGCFAASLMLSGVGWGKDGGGIYKACTRALNAWCIGICCA